MSDYPKKNMINCIIQFNSNYTFWIQDLSSFTLTSGPFSLTYYVLPLQIALF